MSQNHKSHSKENEENLIRAHKDTKKNHENDEKESKSKTDSEPKTFKEYFDDIEVKIEDFVLKQLPKIPENVKETLVQIIPIINLVFLVIGGVFILLGLGLASFFGAITLGYTVTSGFGVYLSIIPTMIGFVLRIMALPGLFKQEKRSWRLSYYAVFFDMLSSLIKFDFAGLIIGPAISFYIWFQIKSKYKN